MHCPLHVIILSQSFYSDIGTPNSYFLDEIILLELCELLLLPPWYHPPPLSSVHPFVPSVSPSSPLPFPLFSLLSPLLSSLSSFPLIGYKCDQDTSCPSAQLSSNAQNRIKSIKANRNRILRDPQRLREMSKKQNYLKPQRHTNYFIQSNYFTYNKK